MVHWSTRLAALALATGLTLGCGDRDDAASPTAPGTPANATPAATPSAPSSASQAPPELQLTWLPGGGLALENTDGAPVSLARQVTLTAAEGAEPRALSLGLDCAAPSPAAGCITLVPGAGLAIGGWPDDHGACRYPPCDDPAPTISFAVQTCDSGHTVTHSLPER
mgnify:FL=1